MQQGPPGGDEAQQKALEAYEQMLNTFENNAKDFWGMWGAPGESMVQGIEASVRDRTARSPGSIREIEGRTSRRR
jgi:hypothetical protein